MVIVHSESWSLPVNELDLANRIFDRWRDEERHPSMLRDTGSLVVKYVQAISVDDDGINKNDDGINKNVEVSGDGHEEDAAGSDGQ
jgi:hypothetical protein